MFYEISKRLLDIVGSVFALVIFAPILILFAILVKLEDGGPVFVEVASCTRLGKNRKSFYMYKFRSMIPHAHERMLNDPEFKKFFAVWKAQGKLKVDEDPRITKIGRIIRKYDLDELPQFINVLIGNMSIVGPRACFQDEIDRYVKEFPEAEKYFDGNFSIKPGITGPWQISGRNSITVVDRFRMNAEYAKRKNVFYDIYIIFKTPIAMISRVGAYE